MIASVHRDRGERDAALERYRQAHKIYAQWVPRRPGDKAASDDLASLDVQIAELAKPVPAKPRTLANSRK